MNVQAIIERFQLEPLREEGGYYRRIYNHPTRVEAKALPDAFEWSRELVSGIYYLVTPEHFSSMHRLNATETFHFHLGDTLEMLQLSPEAPCGWQKIGNTLEDDVEPFVAVPGGVWQGTRLCNGGKHGFALLSVMVSPGFDWEDFQLGDRKLLEDEYPEWRNGIESLTR